MEYQEYKFRVSHDNGSVILKTKASSEEAAINIIMKAEGCPKRALERIDESTRYTELCGITENKTKKQLINEQYQDKVIKKKILKEELDPNEFDIIEFSKDEYDNEEEKQDSVLYKMKNKKK